MLDFCGHHKIFSFKTSIFNKPSAGTLPTQTASALGHLGNSTFIN
jgi:hypothetical protein